MPKPDPAVIASQIEQLPFELFEPIFEALSFRDVIALAKYAGANSRLAAALETSPKWRDIWPTYKANEEDFQTLVSLVVPIGGNRMFDPTLGALDVTPGQFHRRFVREQSRHGVGFSFYDYVTKKASDTIQKLLQNVDPVTMAFICRGITLGDIAIICPWLKNMVVAAQQRHSTARAKAVEVVRDKFSEAMGGVCRCVADPYFGEGLLRNRNLLPGRPGLKSCSVKHPDRSTQWTVSQMKAFVSAYSVLQTQLNVTKASQLRTLAKLYTQHHSRLKEARAPQGPRYNTHHIPNQLEIVSRFVSRIIDLDRSSTSGTKQGRSKFRYVHPYLIPYNWCLQLWLNVNEINPNVGGILPSPFSVEGVKSLEDAMGQLSLSPTEKTPPKEVVSQIEVVNAGIERFFKRSSKWGQEGCTASRTQISKTDASDRTPIFSVYEYPASAIQWSPPRSRWNMLPPIDAREMEWLQAFLKVVEWMEEAYPELAAQLKSTARDEF